MLKKLNCPECGGAFDYDEDNHTILDTTIGSHIINDEEIEFFYCVCGTIVAITTPMFIYIPGS